MLNIEKYKDEIKKIGIYTIAVVNGTVTTCGGTSCRECDFRTAETNNCCEDKLLEWLTTEYQPKGGRMMAESNYCDDYDCLNDDCDCDCDNCNHEECDEHPHQKYLHRYMDFVNHENANSQ